MKVTQFLKDHYKHFNAAALIDAAEGYKTHLNNGGKMMITLAGAMSTAELGIILAETSSTWWPMISMNAFLTTVT
jgi:deoxyhypusine synthase